MKLFGSSKNEIPFRLGKEFKVPIDEKGYHHFFIERAKKDKHILIKGIGIRDTVDNAINPNYSEDEFRQHCQESFNLLKEHLGKYLPDTMLVYGKDKNNGRTGYIVMREIMPPEQKLGEQAKTKQEQQLDELFVDIIAMWENTGSKLLDLREIDSIRYGHTNSNP
ncbi:hypothetical protein COV56_03575 [Candidatus Kuenenbacteria bacterium CG11_big_fil_rev_8_21_14_0_20_37_9]|nr:MAG: hypothetical protein COV56_03575 [Candidatus Kuenenbacteria bacterium CG11_big_fil_rev_8_21_14_0_20_37_9]